MNTQMQYAEQVKNYTDLHFYLQKYTLKHKALVVYAIFAYKDAFYTLEESNVRLDDVLGEARALVKNDRQVTEIDRLIERYANRPHLCIASILTFFMSLTNS